MYKFENVDQVKMIVDKIVSEHLATRKGAQLDELTMNVDKHGYIIPSKRFGKTSDDVVAICMLKIPFKFKNSSVGDENGTIKTESFTHQIYDTDVYMVTLSDVLTKMRDNVIDDILEND